MWIQRKLLTWDESSASGWKCTSTIIVRDYWAMCEFFSTCQQVNQLQYAVTSHDGASEASGWACRHVEGEQTPLTEFCLSRRSGPGGADVQGSRHLRPARLLRRPVCGRHPHRLRLWGGLPLDTKQPERKLITCLKVSPLRAKDSDTKRRNHVDMMLKKMNKL